MLPILNVIISIATLGWLGLADQRRIEGAVFLYSRRTRLIVWTWEAM